MNHLVLKIGVHHLTTFPILMFSPRWKFERGCQFFKDALEDIRKGKETPIKRISQKNMVDISGYVVQRFPTAMAYFIG